MDEFTDLKKKKNNGVCDSVMFDRTEKKEERYVLDRPRDISLGKQDDDVLPAFTNRKTKYVGWKEKNIYCYRTTLTSLTKQRHSTPDFRLTKIYEAIVHFVCFLTLIKLFSY